MRSKRYLTLVVLPVALMCFLLVSSLQADIFIKQKRHTDAFQVMGKTEPAKDEVTVMWMAKHNARVDQGESGAIIILKDKNIMYMINHEEKTYTEMPFTGTSDILTRAISKSGLSEEEKAEAQKFMKGFMKMMKPKVAVSATGEKQKIKDWNCSKYILKAQMMGTTSTSEIWATEDIKIDYELFRALSSAFLGQQPGFQEMFKEMQKIKGVAVLTRSTASMMGAEVKSTEELVEVADRKAPAGTYEVPEGYKKVN
ncbi:MAG: DUF4412 domain-containing protein [Candidatus Aminicenantales bacterium]